MSLTKDSLENVRTKTDCSRRRFKVNCGRRFKQYTLDPRYMQGMRSMKLTGSVEMHHFNNQSNGENMDGELCNQ